MKDHVWNNIAYEKSLHIDDEAMMWRWCSHCGAMGLGCDVYYIDAKMTPIPDEGCPDLYTALFKDMTEVIEKAPEKVTPRLYVDPFDMAPADME